MKVTVSSVEPISRVTPTRATLLMLTMTSVCLKVLNCHEDIETSNHRVTHERRILLCDD